MGQNGGLKIWYYQRNSHVLQEYNFSTRFSPLYLPTLHSISQPVFLMFFIQASIEKFPNSLRMHFDYYFIHNQYMEINSTRAQSLSPLGYHKVLLHRTHVLSGTWHTQNISHTLLCYQVTYEAIITSFEPAIFSKWFLCSLRSVPVFTKQSRAADVQLAFLTLFCNQSKGNMKFIMWKISQANRYLMSILN